MRRIDTDSDTSGSSEVDAARRTRRRPIRRAFPPSADLEPESDEDELDGSLVSVRRKMIVKECPRAGLISERVYPDDDAGQVGAERLQSRREGARIVIYRDLDDQRSTYRMKLDVKSESFRTLLHRIGDVDTLTCEQDFRNLRFVEPFTDLFFRRDALRGWLDSTRKTVREEEEKETKENAVIAEHVLRFLEHDMSSINTKFDQVNSSDPPDTIEYMNLWMIYRPGSLVFTTTKDGETTCIMVDSVYFEKPNLPGYREDGLKTPRLKLGYWTVDYDGEKFGRRAFTTYPPAFVGAAKISSLAYVPERFMHSVDEIKTALSARGRKFWALQGPNFCEVVPLSSQPWQRTAREAERVMVDHSGCPFSSRTRRYGRRYRRPPAPISSDDDSVGDSDGCAGSDGNDLPASKGNKTRDRGFVSYREQQQLRRTGGDFISTTFERYDVIDPSSEPDELTLLLCSRLVYGFSLRGKGWHRYKVTNLRPVRFREDAWSRLVLDPEYKDIVQAMAKSHLNGASSLQDLVAAKGNGLVMLLHGPAGVGKTLTAECAAESLQRPLYMVTAGDLGITPGGLESKLEKVFDRAKRWDAIILLDEADVFLQDRDQENLTRNALVSIFLRTLEYFSGIIFLTTNRVETIDQAFQSRIHITLGLPEFDLESRKAVWRIFMADLGKQRVTSEEDDTSSYSPSPSSPFLSQDECRDLCDAVLASCGAAPLNGRQIRNCVRSALALAEQKGRKPDVEDFQTVIRVGITFAVSFRDAKSRGHWR